jgi:flagellar FliL protein
VAAAEKSAGTEIVDGAAPLPKKGKRKLVIGAAAVAVVLGGGGGAYALMGGKADSHAADKGDEAHADAGKSDGESEGGGEGEGGGHDEGGADKFVDVPAMVVNLRNADGGSHFIKLHFMLVPGAKATPDGIKDKLPVLLDAYQPFLRELRPEDLAGSAAVFRIKEELLVRAADTIGAGQVKDVLIQDLIQQ